MLREGAENFPPSYLGHWNLLWLIGCHLSLKHDFALSITWIWWMLCCSNKCFVVLAAHNLSSGQLLKYFHMSSLSHEVIANTSALDRLDLCLIKNFLLTHTKYTHIYMCLYLYTQNYIHNYTGPIQTKPRASSTEVAQVGAQK